MLQFNKILFAHHAHIYGRDDTMLLLHHSLKNEYCIFLSNTFDTDLLTDFFCTKHSLLLINNIIKIIIYLLTCTYAFNNFHSNNNNRTVLENIFKTLFALFVCSNDEKIATLEGPALLFLNICTCGSPVIRIKCCCSAANYRCIKRIIIIQIDLKLEL